MNKISKIAYGTMLSMALASTAWAHMDIFERGAVWVTGNYTEPSNNGMSYGAIVQSPGDNIGRNGEKRHVFVNNDLEFDYALGFSYHIADTRTRAFVSYDHFSDANDANNENTLNLNNIDPNVLGPSAAWGHVHNHADEVRVGLSHALDFNSRFHLDLATYFEWDEVKCNLEERVSGVGDDVLIAAYRNTYNRFQGWGPGLGARARAIPVSKYSNVGFFMGMNAAMMWGDNVYASSFRQDIGNGEVLAYHYDPEVNHSLVGKLDVSFGLDYRCYRQDLSDAVVNIALGIRYMNMFNVFKNGNAYQNPVYRGSNNVDYAANLGYPNDWGRVGPFLTFAIGGAGA